MRITLCLNCLETGSSPVAVGPEKGTQREPYHDTIDLCEFCKSALLNADFAVLFSRHRTKRTITTVGAQGER